MDHPHRAGRICLITPFLAIVNVPLSAYSIVQEPTYRPNDTLPAVFLGNLVPSVLQNPADSFSPQLLSVGDTLVLDDSVFSYTISQAFDAANTSQPVSGLYYNNPLPDGCDVTNLVIHVQLNYDTTISPYSWNLGYNSGDIRNTPALMCKDLSGLFASWDGRENVTQRAPHFGAKLLQAPCSTNPAQFLVADVPIITFGAEQSVLLGSLGSFAPAQIDDLLLPVELLGHISVSSLRVLYGNLFQTLYNLARLDLGVILENQIDNSAYMYQRSIVRTDAEFDWTDTLRNWTSNATVMAQWQKEVEFFQSAARVPALEYLRPVPRLKPLGSAVTSVFVSTFAMLSVMWTVFSLVVGTLASRIAPAVRGISASMRKLAKFYADGWRDLPEGEKAFDGCEAEKREWIVPFVGPQEGRESGLRGGLEG
ncbi:hypothetical protein MSAN_01118300 [Mycena sanguinolenta]|uniref:Uncharacterized protein n=1 Tax=Mycena sanguinolenta TaxID=230812 RepID=A0A8H6YLG5_9AGAR|nr:hypothetical protein MSAN_01118300 [Mycena sanguinolenta]